MLLVARNGEVRKYSGESIPGFCVCLTAEMKGRKNGKWTAWIHTVSIPDDAASVVMVPALHHANFEEFATLADVHASMEKNFGMSLDMPKFERFFSEIAPRNYARMKKTEDELALLG
jgi:hypothetical protein